MKDRVPPGRAATLAAVIRVYARDGRATVRTVMAEAGHGSTSVTHDHLVALRDAGLVAWDDGRAGTLRPLLWPTRAAFADAQAVTAELDARRSRAKASAR